MSVETKLTRDQFIPFLDVKKDKTFASSEWKRIDKSTIFSLSAGEQTEDVKYICNPVDETEVTGNKPELPQEIAVLEGNAVYDFLIGELESLPVGEDCKVPYLFCFGGSDKVAWRGTATLTDKVINTVDGKVTFTIKVNTVEKGTWSITEGVPTFAP